MCSNWNLEILFLQHSSLLETNFFMAWLLEICPKFTVTAASWRIYCSQSEISTSTSQPIIRQYLSSLTNQNTVFWRVWPAAYWIPLQACCINNDVYNKYICKFGQQITDLYLCAAYNCIQLQRIMQSVCRSVPRRCYHISA